jgi:hypothetical protein
MPFALLNTAGSSTTNDEEFTMITCFLQSQPNVDGTIDHGCEGFLHVRTETGNMITIVMCPDNGNPCRFCSLKPDEARTLALALQAGAQLSTIGHKA